MPPAGSAALGRRDGSSGPESLSLQRSCSAKDLAHTMQQTFALWFRLTPVRALRWRRLGVEEIGQGSHEPRKVWSRERCSARPWKPSPLRVYPSYR